MRSRRDVKGHRSFKHRLVTVPEFKGLKKCTEQDRVTSKLVSILLHPFVCADKASEKSIKTVKFESGRLEIRRFWISQKVAIGTWKWDSWSKPWRSCKGRSTKVKSPTRNETSTVMQGDNALLQDRMDALGVAWVEA